MSSEGEILAAIITEEEERWVTGETIIFKAKNQEEKEKTAILVGRMLSAMVHELPSGVYVVVRH